MKPLYTYSGTALLALTMSLILVAPPADAGIVTRSAARGAVTGAVIGGIVDGGDGAARGAAIGATAGAISGAIRKDRYRDRYRDRRDKWRGNAYSCRKKRCR